MKEGFHTITINLAQANPGIIGRTQGWITDKLQDGTELIFAPLGNAILDLFLGIMEQTPMVFTLAGCVCFILTIVFCKGKFYGYGLGFWALSLIMAVINSDLL